MKSIIEYNDITERDESRFDDVGEHEETPLMGSEHGSSTSSSTSDDVLTCVERNDDYSENWLSRLIESGIIIGSAAIVALYLTNLNWCLSLVGATYGCYIAYFVPSIVYWKAVKDLKEISTKKRVLKYLAILSMGYGVIVCVLGVAMSFSS